MEPNETPKQKALSSACWLIRKVIHAKAGIHFAILRKRDRFPLSRE